MKKVLLSSLLGLGSFTGFAQTMNQIKFTAKIANRNSDTLTILGMNQFKQVIPINKEEVFVATFDAPKGFYQFSDGVEAGRLYVKQNSEFNLTMDAKQFDESIVFKGKSINESNFLAAYALREEKFQNEAFAKEQDEFTALLESKTKTDLETLENGDYDPEFKAVLKDVFMNAKEYAKETYEATYKMNKFKGKLSPDFNYDNHKGGKTKLSDLKGKYVYIDLWATWCGPCRAEIPFLKKMEEKYHGTNIEFVSVSIDKMADKEKWKKFVTDKNLGGIQLFADKDWESDFIVSYNVTGIPRFILLDPKGNVLEANASRPSDPALQVQLDSLLK